MYGPVITELPEGFVPYQQWPEFDLLRTPLPSFNPEVVGDHPRGVRWGVWPLMFEEYINDTEPDMSVSDPKKRARNRLVIWRRLVRRERPQGWYELSHTSSRLEGFADLKARATHTDGWDESARRYRKKWIDQYAGKTHKVEQVGFYEFAAAYERSSVFKIVKRDFLNTIKRKLANTQGTVALHAVRDLQSGELVAGMAILTSQTCSGSFYISGFIREEAGKVPAMIALMDRWFADSHARGIRFLHFGEFWMPGKPKNWKGFSLFKAKFGLYYIAYPPVLVRFMRGKIF